MTIGIRRPTIFVIVDAQPAVALTTIPARIGPRVVCTPRDAAAGDVDPGHLRVLVDLDALLFGSPGVAPDDRVVADDAARRMPERGEDREPRLLREVERRRELPDLLGEDHLRVDAHELVRLGAHAQAGDRELRVRERQVAVLAEQHVEAEIDRQPLVELHRLVVERDALRRAVVRADDRGVACRWRPTRDTSASRTATFFTPRFASS